MCLLVSDGLFRFVDTFGCCDADGLINAVRSSCTTALIERLRHIHENNPEGRELPRSKRSDDATDVAFEIDTDFLALTQSADYESSRLGLTG
jgi:hypothetical protein